MLRCALLLSLVFAAVAGAAESAGARVYRQKCADCHGAAGQGVEGKYRDALYGDWALPKLTRYIAKNMPEDDPETLTPAEAAAVSQHVFDAFYSRAAQARLNPARIELAHLTNQQYAITVADLLRRIAGTTADEPAGAHGLTAKYYSTANRGRFDSNKELFSGVDAGIDFNFTEGSADREKVKGLEQFSMQWRGAVRAEETGDYEFIVRTPNSVRVWINSGFDPTEAVMDVNVSRPDEPDHRVTIRLLGGRTYPLGIDYWALPGKAGAAPPPAISLRWKTPHGSERVIPARVLTAGRVRPAFVIATKFPADDSSRGYERSGPVSKEWDEATTSAAFEVANHMVKHSDRLAGIKSGDSERGRKIAMLAERFVVAAFRRPLSAEEKARYVTTRFAEGIDPEMALKRVVLLALKSPHFLYVELPAETSKSDRAAERLSFGLWDSLPDEPLAQAAAKGLLTSRAAVVAQAKRMLGDPRTRAKLQEFFHHWLQMRYIEDMAKDAAAYPDFTPELVEDLRTSLNLFLESVAWGEGADFRELLRADYLFANARLAKFYGLPEVGEGEGRDAEAFARVRVTDGQRAGVLTHPFLLAAFSYKNTTSPIHRGVFLTRSVAGRSLKSPPMAVSFNETEFSPEMTMRQKVVKLTSSDTCQGCHAVINPLGFSLEWFDAVGRFRREEKGQAIDAISEYLTDENQPVRLAGPRDVAEFAIGSEQANFRFIEQLVQHVTKQPPAAVGEETLPRLRDSFIASGYNLQTLLVDIATLYACHGVIAEAAPTSTPKTSP